jgi:PAS domain S-box-containing protein
MFGYTAEEMVGSPITKIIPPELHKDETKILSTIASGGRIDHFETVRVTKEGQPIEVSLTVSPVKDESGKIVGAAKIARDITQKKKTERSLHTAERLASVGRLAATVAHEINNPLEALTNLIYLARHSEDPEERVAYLAQAEEELGRIAHLTRQTLGFYRETKEISSIRVGTLVASLLLVFSSRAKNKGVELYSEVSADPEIRAVPGEIRQLIANLISNSIDAVNGSGKIRVRVSDAVDWKQRERKGVRLTVADSGAGIEQELRGQLFEPFFTTKKQVGTGLGLWVCKSIVEQHRGSIRVKSSTLPDKSWTVFSVFLPRDIQY